MSRKGLLTFLSIMFVVDAVFIGAVVGATSKSAGKGLLVGALAAGLPVLVIFGLVPLIVNAMGWGALARAYRAERALNFPGAAAMSSIAIRSRGMRLNNCIGAIADDDHLHLSIQFPRSRMLPDVSIPWEAVTDIQASKRVARLELVSAPPIWVPSSLVQRELEVRSVAIDSEPIEHIA